MEFSNLLTLRPLWGQSAESQIVTRETPWSPDDVVVVGGDPLKRYAILYHILF